MKVLTIGSHPDDVELGMAGTIARHTQRNDDIRVILCTLGGVSGDPKERKQEAHNALDILGVEKSYMLDYPISGLNVSTPEFVKVIKKIIDEFNPDRVYTHSPRDYHQVHVSVSNSVVKATRDVKQVLFYETISSTTTSFHPNAYVDITQQMELKVDSLKAHGTQSIRPYLQPNVLRSLANTRYIWGKVGTNPEGFAEGFEVYRFIF